MKVKWDKNRKIRHHLYHAPKVDVDCESILVELVLTVVCTDQNSGNTKNWKGKDATIAVEQRKSKSIEHRWLADPQYH